MEASSQSRAVRGMLSNCTAAPYSREVQDMLKLMMQESKLSNLQRKQINECLKTPLPPVPDPPSPASPPRPKASNSLQKRLPCKPQRRTAESCRSGNSYVREKFCPAAPRDLEKEKRRLQNIMATGQEEPWAPSSQSDPARWKPEVMEERDLYQEVLDEIEERREFLADMAALGQEKQYINIINTEISQKIRQLEVLEKAGRAQRDAVTPERREESARCVAAAEKADP